MAYLSLRGDASEVYLLLVLPFGISNVPYFLSVEMTGWRLALMAAFEKEINCFLPDF